MRLKAKDISDIERDQHSEWINESPDHQKAYRDLNQQWDDMDELTPWARDEVKRLQSRFESETNESQGEHYSLSRKLRNLSRGKRRKSNLIWTLIFALAITSILSAVFITTPWPWLHTKIDYETKTGEQRKVVLPDGSLLHLNTGTSVEIDFSAEARNVELIKGEALFDVVQASNRPFAVDVIDHNVVAVGTTFNLQITNAALKIAVVEGQVAVRHQDPMANSSPDRGGEHVEGMLLKAGQGVEVNADGIISEATNVNVDRAIAWDRGLLVFDGLPLRQATEKMSRYMLFDIRVVVGVPDKIVRGEIQIRDQETMLKQFAKIAQVTPVRQSAQLTLLYTASQ